jgi:hypothetical protein
VVAALLAAAGARRATASQTGVPALTGSERRICALAAQGHSNSFRKQGVRRRTELAGGLAAEPAVPER